MCIAQIGHTKTLLAAITALLIVFVGAKYAPSAYTSNPTGTVTSSATSATQERTPFFTLYSDDKTGITKYTVGGYYEPSGKYEIICKSGHGVLTIDGKGYCFAADEYKGKENGSKTFEESVIVTLQGNEQLSVRNYHSSAFSLEVYWVSK